MKKRQLRSEDKDADDSRSWPSCCTKGIRLTFTSTTPYIEGT